MRGVHLAPFAGLVFLAAPALAQAPAAGWSGIDGAGRQLPPPSLDGITVIHMRFRFDPRKSRRLRENSRRGIGFEEAQEIFARPYYQDQRSDVPEQYRAIGWVDGRLYTIVLETQSDAGGGSHL